MEKSEPVFVCLWIVMAAHAVASERAQAELYTTKPDCLVSSLNLQLPGQPQVEAQISLFEARSSPPVKPVYKHLCLAILLGPIFCRISLQELMLQTTQIPGSWEHSNLSNPIR